MIAALLALAAMGGTPLTEGRWWWIYSDADNAWFIDTLSIDRSGDRRRFWYETVSRMPTKKYAYRMVREIADCANRTLAEEQITTYGSDGVAYSSPGSGVPVAMPPDSNGENALLFACSTPDKWQSLGALPTERPPDHFTRDFYFLIGIGMTDAQAALTASVAVATHPDWVETCIERFAKPEVRGKLREAYGLPQPKENSF